VELWDGAERRVVRLTGRQCSVGRDAGCDVVVANEWVSGLHARLTRSDAGVEITDLGSTNGTWLGEGERYLTAHTPVPLAWGQVVLIGREVRLALLHPDEETAGEAGAAL
jgi:two-component system, NtrC family, response regulator HydG